LIKNEDAAALLFDISERASFDDLFTFEATAVKLAGKPL